MYWQIALLSPPFSTLTYAHPDYFPKDSLSKGQRVCVPLGKSLRCGILAESIFPQALPYAVRNIVWPLDRNVLLNRNYLQMSWELAKSQLKTPGQILASILPLNLREARQKFIIQDQRFPNRLDLFSLRELSEQKKKILAGLWLEGKIKISQTGSRDERICVLTREPPWPLRPNAVKQSQIMEYLWENGPQSKKKLLFDLGSWVSNILPTLEKKGLLAWQEPVSEESSGHTNEDIFVYNLTSEQEQALDYLKKLLYSSNAEICLLFGITGSGKTLIYLRLVHLCLQNRRPAIILVPEVALAISIWEEIKKYFRQYSCYLYHGYQTAKDREQTFKNIACTREPFLVVGTRSAIFLPYSDLGLIVLDEEHDTSFKQEERMQYQVKEVAYFLNDKYKGLLLPASATPDIKTYYAACQGNFPVQKMRQRVNQQALPRVQIIDMRKNPPVYGPLTEDAHHQLKECLQKGEQVILLLNRRGYAPLVYCVSCGQVIRCVNCDVGMTYYKKLERLVCHYCGLTWQFPMSCPYCGAHEYIPISQGTEQVEEYLASELSSQTKVLRMDRDSTRKQGKLEDILNNFSKKQAQVLVGTQMCSKGHNFPGVTLVIVLDGDVGLNLPDYRATERTFQLLHQVAGRAGRGEKEGKVIIQTRNPGHYCWQYIISNDYEGFYEHELSLRKKLGYPPFLRLGLLRMSFSENLPQGYAQMQNLAKELRDKASRAGVQVLGPAPAPLGKLKGRIRYQCLIKAKDFSQIRRICSGIMAKNRKQGAVNVSLDLDPVQML